MVPSQPEVVVSPDGAEGGGWEGAELGERDGDGLGVGVAVVGIDGAGVGDGEGLGMGLGVGFSGPEEG